MTREQYDGLLRQAATEAEAALRGRRGDAPVYASELFDEQVVAVALAATGISRNTPKTEERADLGLALLDELTAIFDEQIGRR